jgi:plasmid stabilization system protein ParE
LATGQPILTVVLTDDAADELDAIWRYNAGHRSHDQADDYDAFLKGSIATLGTDYSEGKPVEGFPELRHTTFKKSRRGDGHIVVYEVLEARQIVAVLHIFHTTMDVIGRLSQERGS